MFKVNEGKTDRTIRIFIGIASFMAAFLVFSGVAQIIFILIGTVAFITGISGFCGLYSLFGVNTCNIKNNDRIKVK